MDSIREYLIGVVAAALICAVCTALISGTTGTALGIKVVCGLLMALAVVRPWIGISLDNRFDWYEDIHADGMDCAETGKVMANEAYRNGIKQQIEAYILDEAEALGCDLQVEVTLSGDETPVPEQVRLYGEVSPYARQTITVLLAETLGIEREEQIWM